MYRSILSAAWLAVSAFACFGPALGASIEQVSAQPSADGGRYTGPLVDGMRQGRGRIEWSNGASYEGGFDQGLLAGKGRLRYPTGDVYDGEFAAGMESGQGTLTIRSGAVYVGDFRDGVMAGQGRYDYGNGTVYEGAFRDSLFHGQGRLITSASEYVGEFRAGEMTGRGEIRYKDGRRYVGDFVRGDFEGQGRFENASAVFEGEFRAGAFTGAGATSWPGGARHEGQFRDWRPHGTGTFRDGHGGTYEGTFESGELTGVARLSLADGSRYEGAVRNLMPHGEGTMSYAKPQEDGRTHDSGEWQYGRLKKQQVEERRRARDNVERALYRQPTLLAEALRGIEPQDPSAIDMYLLAVAGDGSQEVFRREVEFVRKQFDTDFGTRGRSLALVNSRSTAGGAPMATLTSVRQALSALAGAMDRERDILFLYVTSHGSKEREISLGLEGMDLPPLGARELGDALAESGIRWKVIVLSACYAGGFIDALRDPGTLVITAARHDRRSFGCADENEFTYFGRAFFKEALPSAGSFQEAFSVADRLVTQWEQRDAGTAAASKSPARSEDGHSLPQMADAPPIRAQLDKWWAQLAAQRKLATGAVAAAEASRSRE